MTDAEKKLLMKDLCGRLPYGVKIHIDFNGVGHIVGDATLDTITSVTGQLFDFVDFEQDFKNGDCLPIGGLCGNKKLHINEFKPYLRPMSSMTEEELIHYSKTREWKYVDDDHYEHFDTLETFDWLNEKGFDYRGLIPMGLALELTDW